MYTAYVFRGALRCFIKFSLIKRTFLHVDVRNSNSELVFQQYAMRNSFANFMKTFSVVLGMVATHRD